MLRKKLCVCTLFLPITLLNFIGSAIIQHKKTNLAVVKSLAHLAMDSRAPAQIPPQPVGAQPTQLFVLFYIGQEMDNWRKWGKVNCSYMDIHNYPVSQGNGSQPTTGLKGI